ncbi:hypothetical protein EV426DRAFT_577573 [Tirmania nivea]|nr:hypothetical protein EV426DRAFT_577573 [Tirmania nivea]
MLSQNSNSIEAQMGAFEFPATNEPQFPPPSGKTNPGDPAPLPSIAIGQLHLLATQKFLEERDNSLSRSKARGLTEAERRKMFLTIGKKQENQDELLRICQERGLQIQKKLFKAKAKLNSYRDSLAQIEAANAGKLYVPGGLVFRFGAELAIFISECRIDNPVSPFKARIKVLEAQNEVAKQEERLEAYKRHLLREVESVEPRSSRLGHFGPESQCGMVERVSEPLSPHTNSQRVGGMEAYEADIEYDDGVEGSCYWHWDEDDEGDTILGESTPEVHDEPWKNESQVESLKQGDSQSAAPPSGHAYVVDPNPRDYSLPSPRDDTTPAQEIMDSDTDNDIIPNHPPSWQPFTRTVAEMEFYYRALHESDARYGTGREPQSLYDTKNYDFKPLMAQGNQGDYATTKTRWNSPPPPAVASEDTTESLPTVRSDRENQVPATNTTERTETSESGDMQHRTLSSVATPVVRTETPPLAQKRGLGSSWNEKGRHPGHAMCTMFKKARLG